MKRVKKRAKRDLEILSIKVNKVKMMTMILKMTRVTSVLRIILNLFPPRNGISSKGLRMRDTTRLTCSPYSHSRDRGRSSLRIWTSKITNRSSRPRSHSQSQPATKRIALALILINELRRNSISKIYSKASKWIWVYLDFRMMIDSSINTSMTNPTALN